MIVPIYFATTVFDYSFYEFLISS